MPEEKQDDYQRLSSKDLLKISIWSVNLLFTLCPFYSGVFLALTIVGSLTGIANSYIFSKVIDNIVILVKNGNTNVQQLVPFLIILISFNTASIVIGRIKSYARNGLGYSLRPIVRRALYTKINTLGIQTLEGPEINNKIDRAQDNLSSLLQYFATFADLVGSLAAAVTAGVIVFSVSPILTVIILITLIPRYLTDKKYRRLDWKYDYDNTEANRMAAMHANDLMDTSVLQETFINNSFSFLDQKFYEFKKKWIAGALKIIKEWYLFTVAFSIFADLGVYGGYFVILSKFLFQKITVGTTVFWIRSLDSFQDQIFTVMQDYNDISDIAIRLKDAYALFNTESEIPDGNIKLPVLHKGPDIEFQSVRFEYPNSKATVINNFNLKIKSGEKIAIVGQNGAGKTTLAKLICRLYKTTEGQILINNTNIDEIMIDSWYQNIGVLYQEYPTYPQLSVRENIIIADPKRVVYDDNVEKALSNADALEFVNAFPQKLDQILSMKFKGGIRPSTGQWQKLALARFFYRNSPLVIFDEPTASIDAISEFNIFNQIYKFFENKTVIIISHRFSTVRNADRIIVLEKGAIIEEGSHNELMAKNGYYTRSFNLQAQGYN